MYNSEDSSKIKATTVETKLKLIHQLENGKSTKDVSEEFGINRNTLNYIFKNKNKYKEKERENPTLLRAKRIRDVKYPQLEIKILDHIYESRDRGEKVSGFSIKSFALTIAAEMKCDNFSGSNGWLCSFLKRHRIRLSEFNEEINTSQSETTNWTVHEVDQSANEEFIHVQCIEEAETTEGVEEIITELPCRLCGSENETLSIISEIHFSIVDPFVEGHIEDFHICQSCEVELENILQIINKWRKTEEALKLVKTSDQLEDAIDEEIIEEALEEEMILDESLIQSVDIIIPKPANIGSEEASIYEFKCHICSENFQKMFELTQHTRTEHKCSPQVACECGKFLSTWESLMIHKRKHSDQVNLFNCDTCQKGFTTQTGLNIHNKLAHMKSPKIFACDVCGKIFKDAQNFHVHQRTHLPDEEKFCHECNFCGKKLANKFSLKHHIENIHNGIKICACQICGKKFGNKSNLRSHMFSHSREDLACDLCDKVKIFKNRLSLQTHKLNIHNPDRKKRPRTVEIVETENFEIVYEYSDIPHEEEID